MDPPVCSGGFRDVAEFTEANLEIISPEKALRLLLILISYLRSELGS